MQKKMKIDEEAKEGEGKKINKTTMKKIFLFGVSQNKWQCIWTWLI